jgi:hypothetical protein
MFMQLHFSYNCIPSDAEPHGDEDKYYEHSSTWPKAQEVKRVSFTLFFDCT